MKSLLTAVLLATFVITGLAVDSAEARNRNQRVKKAQKNQMKRIRHGVKNGSVTKREAKKMLKQQRRINKARKEAASDGKITNREMMKLRKRQAKASGNIWRKKHNNKNQGGN